MQQRDYIERLIEQIVAAIAQILGLAEARQFTEAEQAIDAAWSSLVGLRRADADRLDDATLRLLLGAKIGCASRLFDAEATLEQARGRETIAAELHARAARLR